MLAADIGAGVINAAVTVRLQMLAVSFYEQHPVRFILVNFHVVMRDLPQQVFEVRLRARGVDVLRDIGATDGPGAE